MSYDIQIYHKQVKEKAVAGLELDEFEHPPISEETIERFKERVLKYGYKVESENSISIEYISNSTSCPIQVTVFKTEIAFSIPYWENSEEAILQAIQDATELSDSDELVLYDPQTGDWIE